MAKLIKDLHVGDSNVEVIGSVKWKTDLQDCKTGKFFAFQLFDTNGDNIRIIAFAEAAIQHHKVLEDGKSYRFSKITVSKNNYKGVEKLQIKLEKYNVISPVEAIRLPNLQLTPLASLKDLKKGDSVNVVARIIHYKDGERMVSQNLVPILIVSIMDETCGIDVTFWSSIEKIKSIEPQDLSKTVIKIKNASVNVYNDVISLNVGSLSIVSLNPADIDTENLKALPDSHSCVNLSGLKSSGPVGLEKYSPQVMKEALERDIVHVDAKLKQLKEKKQRYKIRKFFLQQQLQNFE